LDEGGRYGLAVRRQEGEAVFDIVERIRRPRSASAATLSGCDAVDGLG
jgi:hypothetical protein